MILLLPQLQAMEADFSGMISRNPRPPASHIDRVTYQNERWIVGSNGGYLSHSPDGQTWSTIALPYSKSVADVFYWNGVYYAAGADSRALMTSTDLVRWTLQQPAGFPGNPHAFQVIGNRLYCVGWSQGLGYTEDGETWTQVALPDEISRLNGMATNGSRIVLVGNNGLILSSDNGEEWTVRLDGIDGLEGIDDDFLSVSWAGGRFVASGKQGLVMISPDGIAWTLVGQDHNAWYYRVVFKDGAYYFPGRSGRIHRTLDFQSWTELNIGYPRDLRDVAYNGELFLTGGREGLVAFSGDMVQWEQTAVGMTDYLYEVEFGADIFVAADANGKIWKSNDSEAWVLAHEISDNQSVAGLIHDGSQFVAVTDKGNVLTSDDGDTWIESAGFEGDLPARLIQIDDAYWVVGSKGLIATSDNLTNWTVMKAGEADLRDIASGNGTIVVVGVNGTLYSSTDGVNWSLQETGLSHELKSVTYGKGKFVVLGRSSSLLISDNGTNWESLGSPGSTPFDALRLEVIGDQFAYVGYLGQAGTSEDGITWTLQFARTSQWLYDFVVGGNRTVAVGGRGTILSTPFVFGGGYMDWAQVRFNATQLADDLIWGPSANPDHDQRTNAFEFFSNTPPLVADPGPPYDHYIEEHEGSRFQNFEIRRRNDLEGVSLEFWRTDDFSEWTLMSDSEVILVSITPLDVDTDLLHYRLAAPVSAGVNEIVTLRVNLGN